MTDPALPEGYQLVQPDLPDGYQLVDPNTGSPIKPQGGLNSPAGDFLYGLRQPVDEAAQLASRTLYDAFPNSQTTQGLLSGTTQSNQEALNAYRELRGGNPPAFSPARMAGQALTTAPLAYALPGATSASLPARIGSNAVSGAISGLLQPSNPEAPDFAGSKGQNAIVGGSLGALAPLVTGAAARVINPNAVDRIAPLAAESVTPTLGQTAGGATNRIEQGLASIPVIGDFLRAGRYRAVQQFNRGAINQVLDPIGQSLETKNLGRDALTEMSDKVRDAYNAAVPNAGGMLDQQAVSDISKLNWMSNFMPPAQAQQFQSILKGRVLDNVSPAGGLTGESFKAAESDLGKMASDYLYNRNSTAPERQLGGALRELQGTLRDWLERVNPSASADLRAANTSYRLMLPVEDAGARPNEEPGVFGPAQLVAGSKKFAPNARAFARGEAPMQGYAEAGRQVLGSTVPDSGTPLRSMAAIGAAGLAGEHFDPKIAAGALGGGAAAAGLYSPIGTWLMSHLLGWRPPGAAGAATAVRNLSPGLAAAAPGGWLPPQYLANGQQPRP